MKRDRFVSDVLSRRRRWVGVGIDRVGELLTGSVSIRMKVKDRYRDRTRGKTRTGERSRAAPRMTTRQTQWRRTSQATRSERNTDIGSGKS